MLARAQGTTLRPLQQCTKVLLPGLLAGPRAAKMAAARQPAEWHGHIH
jgi:hypothetical protein